MWGIAKKILLSHCTPPTEPSQRQPEDSEVWFEAQTLRQVNSEHRNERDGGRVRTAQSQKRYLGHGSERWGQGH